MSDEVFSAFIHAGALIVSALVTALAASLIGRRFYNQQRLRSLVEQKQQDIDFLLQVERRHCELHQVASGQSNKRKIRDDVRDDGFVWSGKNTTGRASNR